MISGKENVSVFKGTFVIQFTKDEEECGGTCFGVGIVPVTNTFEIVHMLYVK